MSVARIGTKEQIETDKWTAFNVPFSFVNGKSFDPAKEYMYTIAFSSSKEGDIFNGAVGSTLFIDEVELVTGQKK
ncbi:putative glycoside hydrolase [compost metagenome]